MADLDALQSALVKADAAGNADDARALAAEIVRVRGAAAPPPEGPDARLRGMMDNLVNPKDGRRFEATPNARQGFMDPVTGGAQLLTHMLPDSVVNVGNKLNNYIADKTGLLDTIPEEGFDAKVRADEKAYQASRGADSGKIDPQRMAGTALNPLNYVPASKLAVAKSLLGRIAEGATAGGTSGALMPVTEEGDYGRQKAIQTGEGAAVGAAVPVAAAGVNTVASAAGKLVEPMTESGRAAILNRFQNDLIGNDDTVRQKVINALTNAKTIVPGSNPTAGEAMAEIPEATGLAAHQKAISKTPGVSGQFMARDAEQQGAREAALDTVAGTKQALATAEGQRAADASQNYAKAFGNTVSKDPELAKLAENPYYKDALPDALKLAEAKGLNPDTDVTEVQHLVKISLDKLLRRTGDTALAGTEKNAVQSLQSDLVGWLGKNNPDYEAARSAFATASKPINEMEVGQYLKDKLVAPLETGERAAPFAQAVRDAPGTIKRSTGGPRFTELGQVLSPQNEQVVNAILDDLQRKAAFGKVAAGTNLTGGTTIAEGAKTGIHLPNLLSRPAMIANFFMKNIGQGADTKINALAAQQYLNPQTLADALKTVPPNQQQQIVNALLQRMAIGAGASTAARQ